MSVVSGLYRIARAAAWGRAAVRLAQGKPLSMARRVRNKPLFKIIGKITRR